MRSELTESILSAKLGQNRPVKMSTNGSIDSAKASKTVAVEKSANSSAAHITAFPREILQAVFRNLEPKHIKQVRQVCREWSLSSEPFLLQRAHSALREGTMDTLRQISDHERLRRHVKQIVVDAQMFEHIFRDTAERDLREMFDPKFKKQEFKEFNAPRAIEEHIRLYNDQERMATSGQHAAGLRYALKRMPNATSILVTGAHSTWYFVNGPLSRDVRYAPWPSPPDRVGILVKTVLAAVWQVRGGQNAARITSLTTELSNPGSLPGLKMMDLTHICGPSSPRLYTTEYLLRNLKKLSLDVTPELGEVATVFGTMIGNAHRLEELELRCGEDRMWPTMVEKILIHKTWPLLTKLALEAVQMTFAQMTTILAEHRSLKQLHLAFIDIVEGLWEDMVPFLSSMRLEGIFLQCLSHHTVSGNPSHCGLSCRRDDLEARVLGGRINGLKAQTEMVCPYGPDA